MLSSVVKCQQVVVLSSVVKCLQEKNVSFDSLEGKVGRIYMPKQDLNSMALNKMKVSVRGTLFFLLDHILLASGIRCSTCIKIAVQSNMQSALLSSATPSMFYSTN